MEGVEATCSTWPISKMIPVPVVCYYTFLVIRTFLLTINTLLVTFVICSSAWDYSAWVRTYALFLEERMECYRVLKYDVEADRPVRNYSSTIHLITF